MYCITFCTICYIYLGPRVDTNWGEHMLRLFSCWDYFIFQKLVFLKCPNFCLPPYENFLTSLLSDLFCFTTPHSSTCNNNSNNDYIYCVLHIYLLLCLWLLYMFFSVAVVNSSLILLSTFYRKGN